LHVLLKGLFYSYTHFVEFTSFFSLQKIALVCFHEIYFIKKRKKNWNVRIKKKKSVRMTQWKYYKFNVMSGPGLGMF